MDPCLLADPFVVSGWVKTEVGAVESVKVTRSGLVIIAWVSFFLSEEAGAPC